MVERIDWGRTGERVSNLYIDSMGSGARVVFTASIRLKLPGKSVGEGPVPDGVISCDFSLTYIVVRVY